MTKFEIYFESNVSIEKRKKRKIFRKKKKKKINKSIERNVANREQ